MHGEYSDIIRDMARFEWKMQHVVDVRDAVFAARTYIEQRDLRKLLRDLAPAAGSACEFGCGFGRMTPLLTEVAASVTGFEREPEFVAQAQPLFPSIRFTQVATLESVPAADAAFDVVLTFTVLQHLVDSVLEGVVREIKRVLRPGGLLVICEETDVSHQSGDPADPDGAPTVGRPVERYAELFAPLALLETRPRVIEPTYPRPDVGTYMAFR